MVELLQRNGCILKLFLALFLFLSLVEVPAVEARIRHYKWEVKYEYKSPDCFKKLGDTIIVELTNSLWTENVAIHWHGIRQIGTPWSDGTEGVTQCPILPGDTFKYQFVVDRPGTYLYHAHYGMQREAGLYGSIRVALPDGESEPFSYDYDRSIILNDWYHKSTYEHAVGLSSLKFAWVGEPQSLLIQGKGRFDCSTLTTPSLDPDVCNATNPECSPYAMTVVPGKTYRLRVASLTALSALSFQIEGHNMTVVEADGHYVEPFVVKNLFLYSGETYSVLIKADQDPSRNYWMTTNVVTRNATTPPGLAILNYYPNHPRRSPPAVPPAGPAWDNVRARLDQSLAIKAHQGFIPPLPNLRQSDCASQHTKHHQRLCPLNLTEAFDQTSPPDGYDFVNYDIYKTPNNTNATVSNGIYRLQFNTTVDLILQNANTRNPNNSETHPWHLHGHDFWVLGYGEGKFDKFNDPKKYNLVNPIMKNTVPVHRYGWTALRFKADNPGAWAFHCHIESHFYMGMGVVFESGIDKVGKLPSSIMGCGATRGVHRP
ncbi:L-ascorbate oxidase [Prunus yedoensis var. nudiflora]|uniref:L-ascorbate oxidase n=1 Tax=Prunus yedoensis var. nudiflora TaxID=2094558 RepID=A0A314YC22_PRUYE|nr:L-ascorbate oxidase [Prunus yedoensis var. nudiflora]